MNCTYHIRKDFVTDSENQNRSVYGIDALDDSFVLVKSIPDIFFDAGQAQNIVDLFNKENLSVYHLEDAVNDILAETYEIF